MPYLSHNYRFQERSRVKSFFEGVLFIGVAALAIFLTLFIFGWISASAAQTAMVDFLLATV